jgi:TP901 family phage tail tape measure protein
LDDTRILITTGVNIGKSIGEINAAISGLEKKVNSLKLKIEVPNNFGTQINSFIRAVEKMKAISSEQNKVISESQDVYKRLDGSIETVTKSVLKNGEIIQKSKTIHDENKKAMQGESDAAHKLAQSLDEANKAGLDSIKVTRNRSNAITGFNVKSSQGYTITNQRLESDGQTLVGSSELTNYKKAKQDLEAVDRAHFNALRDNNARVLAIEKAHYQALMINRNRYKSEIEQMFKQIDKIDRDHYNALNTNQQRTEARDKQHFLALQQNAKKELDYRQSIAAQQNKINDAIRRFGSDTNAKAQLNGLSAQLSGIKFSDANLGNYRNQLREVENGLKGVIAQTSTATSHSMKMGEAMRTAFQKFPIWILAATAFYAPLRAFQSGIRSIYELDTAMTNLQKVTDATGDQYKDFLDDVNKTATSLGALTVDVINATTEWARLGYTMNQAKLLAAETTIYANVGDMGAEDASKALISAIKGFGIEVDSQGKNIRNIVDIYNEVGNKFAISSAGIGEALRRSASSLSAAGNTVEESVALITAANATLQDPVSVGTALKTVSMRIRGISEEGEDLGGLIPSLEEKFNSLGLSLKKDDNTFKSTFDIFNDLSTVWSTMLTDFQKADITELVAGKRQGNIITSLLDNWKDAQASLSVALNSTGSAARENGVYLDSMKAKVAQFKNEVIGFWENAIDSDSLKGLIDAGTTLVRVFGGTANSIGLLPTVVGLATASVILFTKSGLTPLYAMLQTIPLKLSLLKLELRSVAATSGVTAAAMRGLNVTLASLARFLAPVAIITGITMALTAFTGSIKGNTSAMEENDRAYKEQTDTLKSTLTYYKENYQAVKDDSSVKEELFQLQNKLIDSFGSEASSIDLVNGKYEDQIKLIDTLNKKALETKIKEDQIFLDANTKKLGRPELVREVIDYKSNSDGGADYSPEFGDFKIENAGEKVLGEVEYYKELEKIYSEILDHNNEIVKTQGGSPETTQEWERALLKVKDRLTELQPIYDRINAHEKDKKDLIRQNILSQKEFNDTQRALINDVSGLLSNSTLAEYEKNIVAISEAVNSSPNSDKNSLIDQISQLPNIKINGDLVAKLTSLKEETVQVVDSTDKAKTAFEALTGVSESAIDSITSLANVYETLNSNQTLSQETLISTLKEYPALLTALQNENGQLTLNKDAVFALMVAKETEFKNGLEQKRIELETASQALVVKLSIYSGEIEALEKLDKARFLANSTSIPEASFLESKFNEYKALIDQINGIQSLKGIDFKQAPKDVTDKKAKTAPASPQLKEAMEQIDLTEELINSMNAEYEVRERNIESLERKIKTAEKAKDEITVVELTTKKIKEQEKAIIALKVAQTNMSKEADEARKKAATLGKEIGMSLNTESWFDADGNGSLKYEQLLNSIADKSQKIAANTKLSVKERNAELEKLEKQKEKVEELFSTLQLLKQGWRENSDEILKITDDIELVKEELKNSIVSAAQDIIDVQNKIDQAIVDSYQSQIDALQAKWDAEEISEERSKRQLEIAELQKKAEIYRSGTLTSISDELAKQLGLEQEKADALEKQNEIIKQQQVLQNVQNEKNVRLFQNGQFEWVADPRKVKEETDKLNQMQEDFASSRKDTLDDLLDELKDKNDDYGKWEIEQAKKQAIDLLQAKIKAKQDEINLRNEKFEEEKTAFMLHGTEISSITATSLDAVKGVYGTKWDEILGVLSTKLNAAKQMYAEMINMSSSAVNGATYNPTGDSDRDAKLQEMANNSEAWKTATPDERKKLEADNQQIAKELGGKFNPATGKWDLLKYHTGLQEGTVGDKTPISSILSRLGVKNNEAVLKLLNGEAVIKNPINMIENIVGSFKGMSNMLTGLTPKTATASSAGNVVHNHYSIDKVVANNPDDFVKEMRLRSKFKY